MSKLEIFDPLFCGSDCICGPDVESKLSEFYQDLAWLAWKGVEVHRSKPSRDSLAFERDPDAKAALHGLEGKCLPLVKVDGELRCMGRYPSRAELASWLGITLGPSLYSEEVRHLVAISAAVATGCKSCLLLHQEAASQLGVSDEDIFRAVDTGQRIRDSMQFSNTSASSSDQPSLVPLPLRAGGSKNAPEQGDQVTYLI